MWLECGGGSAESPCGAIQSILVQERGTESGRGAEEGGEIGQGTRLSWCKATTAQLVYSAEAGGERLSPYHLFKEDKEQFMLKDNSGAGTNECYLTWKIQNAIF